MLLSGNQRLSFECVGQISLRPLPQRLAGLHSPRIELEEHRALIGIHGGGAIETVQRIADRSRRQLGLALGPQAGGPSTQRPLARLLGRLADFRYDLAGVAQKFLGRG